MKAYEFDKSTREYKGAKDCQIDPVGSEKAGKDVWLLPADCTFVEPAKAGEHEVAVFNGEKWEIKPDWRKAALYNPETKDEKYMSSIGEKPVGYYEIKQRNETPYYDIDVRDDGVYFIDREPTVEEKNAENETKRRDAYMAEVDTLHARKARKQALGEWTDTDESEYVAKVKALTAEIKEKYPEIKE